MNVKRFIYLLVIFQLMLTGFVLPQQQTGSISGTVVLEDGSLIPGVLVELTGTGLAGKKTAITTERGKYRFICLLAGDYELTFSLEGFKTVKRKGISIAPGAALKMDIIMETGAIQKEIVVTGSAPVVDVRKSCCSVSFSGRFPQSRSRPRKHNTEEYRYIPENNVKNTRQTPLSTFSIDVDTASYSNVRRFIMSGQLPVKDAVRIEEMINYFNYDYPQPEGDKPFSITTEMSVCPWHKSHRLIHIGLQGKKIEHENRPPSNLVFLIDVSGSMGFENKLPLLKKSFKLLVPRLGERDRVAMVVYAGCEGLALDSTPGDQKEVILNALERLGAGGSTAGGAGMRLAYKIAKENFIENGNNRIILATDGDFNVGVSSTSDLVRMVEKKRESGIYLTVLGFGDGNLKDDRMEQLADKGNGNYHYIDNLMEGNKVMVTDLLGTLFTIAKDVKVQVEFNPAKVAGYRLVGYENRLLKDEDFDNDKKDAGELGAGHSVTALYEIIPAGTKEKLSKAVRLKYQYTKLSKASGSDEIVTVKLRYKPPKSDKSKLISFALKDGTVELERTSGNFRFAAAVAQFGMLLKDSKYKGKTVYKDILQLAKGSKGEDEYGYRSEFIRLVKLARNLKG